MQETRHKNGWSTLKRKLAADGVLDKFFVDPLNRKLEARDNNFTLPDDAYFPLLIETHLRDVSGHLDRILAYRREMQELEILAVRAAADYALERDQSKDEHDLALIRLRKPQNLTEKAAQEKAAKAFGNSSADLESGFREIAAGSAVRLGQDLSDTDSETQLMVAMYNRKRDYQDQYMRRHTEPGNAHNFAERAEILLSLLLQDKFFAEAKCRALAAGFKAVYGRDPQAKLAASPSIDELVMWVRNLFEDIGIEDEKESDFDLVVPLVQPLDAASGLVKPADFKRAIESSVSSGQLLLKFSLAQKDLLGRRNVRLRRLAVTYGTAMGINPQGIDRDAAYEAYCRYRGEITPPRKAIGKIAYDRPPITLGTISRFGGPVEFADGPEVVNLDPIGDWTLLVRPNPVTKEDRQTSLLFGSDGSTRWADVKLHLRLRAKGGSMRSGA